MVAIKDRATNQVSAKVVESGDAKTLQGFVTENTAEDATVYTDENPAYRDLPRKHETVKLSVSEYVRDQAHTNGLESFWSLLKRGYHGTDYDFNKDVAESGLPTDYNEEALSLDLDDLDDDLGNTHSDRASLVPRNGCEP